MIRWPIKNKEILIFLIVIYSLCGITAFVISAVVYRTVVLPVPFIAVIPVLYIFVLDFNKKQYNKYSRKQILRYVIYLLLIITVFSIVVPEYSYSQAKDLVINNLDEQGSQYVIMPLEFVAQSILLDNPRTLFFLKHYVVQIKTENKIFNYIINPSDGTYFIDKVHLKW